MHQPNNHNKEDYKRISEHVWVKKDKFNYFTEKDVVERLVERNGMSLEEGWDFYRLFMQYIKNKIENPENDYDTGYYVKGFGYFQKRRFKVDHLFSGRDTMKYKRAKVLLDAYMELKWVKIKPEK